MIKALATNCIAVSKPSTFATFGSFEVRNNGKVAGLKLLAASAAFPLECIASNFKPKVHGDILT